MQNKSSLQTTMTINDKHLNQNQTAMYYKFILSQSQVFQIIFQHFNSLKASEY
jgi:hypothetical protein